MVHSIIPLGVVALALLLALLFAKDGLKAPSRKDLKLKKYGKVLGCTLFCLVLLYLLFHYLGQPQRGYITSIGFLLAAALSLVAFVFSKWVKDSSKAHVKSGKLSSVLSAGLSVAGLTLLFSLFDAWNDSGKVPVLLTGYALGAALLAVFVRDEDIRDTTHDLFAIFAVVCVASLIITKSKSILLLAALGILASAISVLITKKRWFPGLLLSHVLGLVAVIFIAKDVGTGYIAAGVIGTIISLLNVPLTVFYTESKYRPSKSLSKGKMLSVLFESAVVPVLLIGVCFTSSYFIGLNAGSGLVGVVFAILAMLTPSVFVCALRNTGERARSISKSYKALWISAALVLLFAAYQSQMISLVGDSSMIVNISKFEVLLGLFIGVVVSLISAALVMNEAASRRLALLFALIVTIAASLILKAEAAAAIVAGLALIGCTISWSLSTIKSSLAKRGADHRDAFGSFTLALSVAALTIAPLLI